MQLAFDKLEKQVQELKDQNKTIVFCHGCFGKLHKGHLKLFQEAKKHADILMVGVESDQYLRQKKGNETILSQQERIQQIENTDLVDIVFPLPEGTVSMYKEIYRKINPNFLITAIDEVSEKKKQDAESLGIKVIFLEK